MEPAFFDNKTRIVKDDLAARLRKDDRVSSTFAEWRR